ncbi:MAG: GTPase ObgE [Planctomycetaceae bacterium]|nr:GTPase ObgE [Planctomycetaceae bacterium]
MFVDRVTINVHSGKGGDGAVSFRREKFIPRGGPDGGDGGDGGSVIIVAQPGVDSLAMLAQKRHWTAQAGEKGRGANCFGRKGEDITLPVPPGTIVYDSRGFVLKDLAHPGDTLIAAKGGKGGKGNTNFKTSTNRAPRQSTPGEDAEVRELVLELKVIADVGLIGLPNAGKSTLLSRLSRARPEIADYPFTTKFPNLGIVNVGPDRQFVLADIPGLIEGAHAGVGLGHEFLRHVERAGLLVHLVEPFPADESDPVANYRSIRKELGLYAAELGTRPEIVVMSKCELPESELVHAKLTEAVGREVLPISAVTGEGLNKLLYAVLGKLDERRAAEAAAAEQPASVAPPSTPNPSTPNSTAATTISATPDSP